MEDLLVGSIPDEVLIRRFVETGESDTFVTLLTRHLPFLRKLLFGLLNGNREDMQDVEQEILAALWSQLPRFRFNCTFSTYLYRFARNKAVDHIRKAARHRRAVDAVGRQCPNEQEAHQDWVRRWEERDTVLGLLSRLSEDERVLVTLKELDGRSIAEIAEITGTAVGTVKSRLHRIRRKIASTSRGEWK